MANLSNWYEAKTLKVQKLVDVVCEKTRFVVTDQQYDEFLFAIRQHGVDSAEQFEDAFFAEYPGQGQSIIEEFINDWMKLAKGCLSKRLLQENNQLQLWNDLVQYDFYKLSFCGNTYFFKRLFS
jgi:hypothetical protein